MSSWVKGSKMKTTQSTTDSESLSTHIFKFKKPSILSLKSSVLKKDVKKSKKNGQVLEEIFHFNKRYAISDLKSESISDEESLQNTVKTLPNTEVKGMSHNNYRKAHKWNLPNLTKINKTSRLSLQHFNRTNILNDDTPKLTVCEVSNEVIISPTKLCVSTQLIGHAYRMCNSSHNIPTQFTPTGNSIIKPGIPKLSAQEVGDDVSICPVILHPTKQLSSHVQMKSEALIKTIGFSPARSQQQSRIVSSSFQRSIMESHNVTPLIITPTPHVIHTASEIVPAKIVPIPSTPISHFSVINKTGSYDALPDYNTGIRQTMVSGTPPVYTQSDFARFPPKSYHHKSAVINPAVIHGPIIGNIDEPCLNIPNSQHVFKPIISPRPSILRKRDADGVLRAQKNLIPILTKTEHEDCQNADDTSHNRNGYSETGLQIESIMVPQIPEVVLPQISALSRQSLMVEISPRKKPRKQLLPVNQDSPFKIVGDDMEYVDEKIIKSERSEEFPDEDVVNCNDDLADGDAEDECEDDMDDNDMDVDDDCPADDDYDENEDDDDDFANDFEDGFDYVKSEKPFFEEVKTSADLSDDSSSFTKLKNKRPTLLGPNRPTYRGNSHHFQRHGDFKIKETKKQIADMQQTKKWLSDSRTGWRVQHLLLQFEGMAKTEGKIVERMNALMRQLEVEVSDLELRYALDELIKDNIQRSKVTRGQLEEITQQLSKIFDYKTLIEDVVDKYCPKELKKKCAKVLGKT